MSNQAPSQPQSSKKTAHPQPCDAELRLLALMWEEFRAVESRTRTVALDKLALNEDTKT